MTWHSDTTAEAHGIDRVSCLRTVVPAGNDQWTPVGDLSIRAADRRKRIPDRHSEDLFAGVRVEGF